MKSDCSKNTNPSFQDVFDYFVNNNLEIIKVQNFYNYYTSRNWLNKNNEPVADWKEEINMWMKKQLGSDS